MRRRLGARKGDGRAIRAALRTAWVRRGWRKTLGLVATGGGQSDVSVSVASSARMLAQNLQPAT